MEIKTSEFFKNIKLLPPPGTQEFEDLVNWEIEKCLGGVTINGVHISGWLYFYLNHWWIRIDGEDKYGNDVRVISLPECRDNEWIRSEALEKAKKLRKGYLEVGARQTGKSEMEASITGYHGLLFENSQNIVVGGNDADLSLIKDKIDFGLGKMWEGLAIPKLDNDWRKPMIRLGFKGKDNSDQVWSYIVVRNVNDGKNTEGPAGTTAKSYIGDEIAKFPFSQSFDAAKPALNGKNGWRCVPILVATGGSFEKGADAEKAFNNPDSNNMLAFTDEETGARTAHFLSGVYRQDCKDDWVLTDWLRDVRKMELPEDTSELDKIIIKVADKEKATNKILTEREEARKSGDQVKYLKAVMYHPLNPQECFLSTQGNYYDGDLARVQRERLINNDVKGQAVDMIHDGEKITYKESKKFPITSYPTKEKDTDAPVIIWEHPVPTPPYGLYVAGVDPYRFDEAGESDSLGAVYIFKRMYDIEANDMQDAFVAAYVSRPKTKAEWNEQARYLIKYYNARALVENDEMSFIEYMIAKGDGHMVEDTPEWLREYAPSSTTYSRPKGVSRANPKIRDAFRSNFKQYMEEPFWPAVVGEDGSIIQAAKLGIIKIPDPVLCEEVSKWNSEDNYDREVAASLAITHARKLDSMKVKAHIGTVDPRYKSLYKELYGNEKITKSPSSMSHLFPGGGGKLSKSDINKLFRR